jgi:exodeoxyribonuclease V beta subunit
MSTEVTPLDPEAILELPLNGVKLIEASAGTGKTYTITNLYILQLFSGRKPSEILVVTFTNAATEELRCRVRDRVSETLQLFSNPAAVDDHFLGLLLKQWQSLSKDEQQLQLRQLQLAIRSMDEAAIYTIHGFCQQSLTDHALATGQFYDVTLLSDDLSLWEDALKDWWRQHSYGLSRSDWQLFNASLGNLASLMKAQKQIRSIHAPRIMPDIKESSDQLYDAWHELEEKLKALATSWWRVRTEVLEILQDSKALSRSTTLVYHPDNLSNGFQVWDQYFESDELLVIPESLEYLGCASLEQNSKPTKRNTETALETGFFLEVQLLLDQVEQIQSRFWVVALTAANQYAGIRVHEAKQRNHRIAFEDQLNLLYKALDGASGQSLARQLRRRFPVAMIDEFQDTDAVQFGIFKHLYFTENDTSLTMIGDPKQAIYSFRGGDIFTYIKARQETVVDHYSLLTNWRSEAGLVQAVNAIFDGRKSPFIFTDAIDYRAIVAAVKPALPLSVNGLATVPVSIWTIPQGSNQKNLSKNETYDLVNRATADEISSLLGEARRGRVKLGEKALASGDIAILVRTGNEGKAMRQALLDRGIRAVTIGRDRVFESEEAQGFYQLLRAVNHFSDRQILRTALASSLLNLDYQQIAQIIDNESDWQDWCEKFRDLHQAWLHRDFITMFQRLLQELKIGERLTESQQGERSLTNLLHLAEICQQHSQVSAGFDALLAWYRGQVEDEATEDTELRLESDEDLVKIVTIHKSKGLEYPVVFVPFLWTCRTVDTSTGAILKFHDDQYNAVIDLGSDRRAEHVFLAEKERLAEDIRLAYVAITRARARVYLVWGDVGSGTKKARPAKTGLGYLLHPGQDPEALNHNLPWAFDGPDNISGDLESLAANSNGTIEVIALPDVDDNGGLPEIQTEPPVSLQASNFGTELANNWRVSSFSSLTRSIHQVPHGGSRSGSDDAILDFPAGSHVGLLLHSILERLDFQQSIEKQCAELLPKFAPRFDLDSVDYRNTITRWMDLLMQSPLNDDGLTLSSLSNRQRMNELAFDFSFDELDTARLNPFLQDLAGQPLEPLESQYFRGLVTGVIDLIFEHNGRFYLADYKSNFLGARLEDYTSDRLRIAMLDRRYDLQYLIYSIALHRYLAQRVPNYSYQKHFGGVYYLFIRAMRPQHGNQYGVFYELPDYDKLLELEQLMAVSK